MTLDEFLLAIRERRLILISEREIWPSPLLDGAIRRALRRHESGLAVLIQWSSITTCPARNLHSQYWRYVPGAGRYVCSKCEELLQEVS